MGRSTTRGGPLIVAQLGNSTAPAEPPWKQDPRSPRLPRAKLKSKSVHVLGIYVGGTKTVCLLGDEEGRVLSTARGPGANLQAVGELQLEKVLHTVMEET